TGVSSLSLHDALPISVGGFGDPGAGFGAPGRPPQGSFGGAPPGGYSGTVPPPTYGTETLPPPPGGSAFAAAEPGITSNPKQLYRSEEHTSELQSRENL